LDKEGGLPLKISKGIVSFAMFAGFMSAQSLFAMPVGVTQTELMCQTADVIVAARCARTVAKRPPSFLGGPADDTVFLIVEKILKNTAGVAVQSKLEFWSGQAADISASKSRDYRGIYFLKRAKGSRLVPVDERHIAVPLSPLSDCSFASGAAPMAVVAGELAKTIGTPAEKFNKSKQPIGQAEDSYRVKTELDQASVIYDQAVDAVSNLPEKYATPPLLKVLSSSDQRCRIRALNALVRLKAFDKLAALEGLLLNPPKSLYYEVGLLSHQIITDDPKYKPIMMRLSQSKDKRIRNAAKENLKFMAENR